MGKRKWLIVIIIAAAVVLVMALWRPWEHHHEDLSQYRGFSAIIRYYCHIPCTSTLLQATACHTFHTLYVLSFLICY